MQASDGNSLLPAASQVADYAKGAWAQSADESVPIQVQRLDTFCEAQKIQSIDLLKVDTQGYEEAVLTGCGDYLSPEKIKCVCLEVLFVPLYENQSCWSSVFDQLRSRGYQLFDLYEKNRKDQKYLAWCDALFVAP